MNKNMIEQALNSEYEYSAKQVLQYADRMSAVAKMRPILEALLAIDGHEDVDTVQLGVDWQKRCPRIELPLKSRARDSHFVRAVVQALHLPVVKEQSGDGLRCVLDVLGITLAIGNYLPENCTVTYEEVLVPSRYERRAKVTCGKKEVQSEESLSESADSPF